MSAKTRVEAGIKFLDKLALYSDCLWDDCTDSQHTKSKEIAKSLNGWRTKLDTSRLDLADGSMCVLGQLFDGYSSGIMKVLDGGDSRREIELGFLDGRADSDDEYISSSRLTAAWKEALGVVEFKIGERYVKGNIFHEIASATKVQVGTTEVNMYLGYTGQVNSDGTLRTVENRSRWDYTSLSEGDLKDFKLYVHNPTPVGSFVLSEYGTVWYIKDKDTAVSMDGNGSTIKPDGIFNPKPYQVNGENFSV